MKNKSLRSKLYFLSGFLIVVAVAVGGVGRWAMDSIVAKYSIIAEVNLPNIQNSLQMDGNIRLAVANAVFLTVPGATAEENKRSLEIIEEEWKKLDENYKEYEAVPFLAGEEELYNAFKKSAENTRALVNQAVELVKKNPDPESAERKQVAQLMLTKVRDSAKTTRDLIAKISDFHDKTSQENTAEAKSAAKFGTLISLLTLLAGSICGGVFAWFFSSALVKTLTAISDSLSQSSVQVSSASGQIAASSQQLSQAATEQAASLEETASSIEEMSAMVKKNSDNAKNTASVSTESQTSAERGRQAMERMLQSMEAINQSNEVIKQQIDNSNNQFGEIVKVINEIGTKTKVINDIVFQTKLLSFNASVEAARAGEHGKGFAVVAEEVGNLAAMSGNAAKEISSLLESSTQKVQAIVEETKTKVSSLMVDGKAKLEEGTGVAKQCGEILSEIVKNVASVSQMSGEIATASEEQSRGVHEITKAMGQLDAVTQTNAATSEEAASAAEELSAQAESLQGLVMELVATVNGRAGEGAAASNYTPPANKKPEKSAKVIAMPVKKPAAAPAKKAAGAEDVPSFEDSRFTEV